MPTSKWYYITRIGGSLSKWVCAVFLLLLFLLAWAYLFSFFPSIEIWVTNRIPLLSTVAVLGVIIFGIAAWIFSRIARKYTSSRDILVLVKIEKDGHPRVDWIVQLDAQSWIAFKKSLSKEVLSEEEERIVFNACLGAGQQIISLVIGNFGPRLVINDTETNLRREINLEDVIGKSILAIKSLKE